MPRGNISCPNILSSGLCNNAACRYDHNILTCDMCNFVASSKGEYESHIQSRKHKRALTGKDSGIVYCRACDRPVDFSGWKVHKRSKRHKIQSNVLQMDINAEPEIVVPLDTFKFCSICQSSILSDEWATHIRSRGHRSKEKYTSFKAALGEAEKEKNGVTIEGEADLGILEPAVGAKGKTISLKVLSTVPLAKIRLVSVKLSADLGSQQRIRVVSPPIVLSITFVQENIGRYQDRLELQFEDEQLKRAFIISRTLRAIVGDRAAHEELKARIPYVPRVRAQREPETKVVEGIAPLSLNAIPYVTKLPRSAIPARLLAVLSLSSQPTRENLESIKHGYLPKLLTSKTHGEHFKTLLWIEEHKMEEDLERYDMPNATLNKRKQYYYLTVPGLAEKRPSVLIGDRILVRKTEDPQGHWYAGHVHIVNRDEVGLAFHQSFRGWTTTQKYHIRFKLTRIPLQRQHEALNASFSESRIFFPDSSHLPMAPVPRPITKTINNLILTNPAQVQAVTSIITLSPGSLPFVVFGPPGTGKTVTIVEAIGQLIQKDANIRILACAPSNSAADLIALRLRGHLQNEELFRMYAPSRDEKQVPDQLKSYSYYRNDGGSRPCFSVPPMATMKKYRVIVSTLISASIAFGIGMPRGHFSHIFIDEAGQATEAEAFTSIKTMADMKTNIVLSGDPKQLGPIIRSGIATHLGLELSYIERIMARPPYNSSVGYGKSIVKLVKNFRSHEAILQFPNERFYENDLQPCGEKKVINAYLGSSYLPNKKFPVIFHSVSGKDEREASSPSFFNIDEVVQVKTYVQQLKADRTFKTSDKNIGIITPYHAQSLKIRRALRDVAGEVKVGSVEEFQGQERDVIIISTVRSSKDFVTYDIKHTLGFVASPRRFNVSITRAKALLIVIGDPDVLGLDPLWRSFLNYIHANSGWRGTGIPWDPSEPVNESGGYDISARNAATLDMNDFTRRMESLTLEGVEEDPDVGVDKPWRELD
ncbi:Putative helicase mov-10-B.1 [Leucoagaricus sp. SymC.cos]|nr:Putative helicase mov-10-B.1 [Leucoagaricus sp. SymC.cos]